MGQEAWGVLQAPAVVRAAAAPRRRPVHSAWARVAARESPAALAVAVAAASSVASAAAAEEEEGAAVAAVLSEGR